MTSHRAVVVQPSSVVIEAFDPPPPGAGQVLIRTRATLISPGTERAFFLALPNAKAAYPFYPGYSAIGEVVAVGDGVEGLRVGERVAAPAPHAAHAVVEASRCLPVPEGLADEYAVFFNLAAIAMQGVHKARIELGEPVAVIGAGLIGLFAAQLAILTGGLPVMVIDQDAGRLELARALGTDAALLAGDRLAESVRELTGADGAAVVIEATGASPAILSAFQIAATRGRVILLGSTRAETDGVNFYRDVHRKGLTLIGAHEITRPRYERSAGWWTQREEQEIALKLLALGRLRVAPLVSHRFGWQDFPQAYALLASWDACAMGIIIQWM